MFISDDIFYKYDTFSQPAVCSLSQPCHAKMPMVAAAWTFGFINLEFIICKMSDYCTKLQLDSKILHIVPLEIPSSNKDKLF